MLKPIYKMSKPNEAIFLAKDTAKLRCDKEKSDGTCDLYFHFLPTPKLEFKGQFPLKPLLLQPIYSNKSFPTLDFPKCKLKTRVLLTSQSRNSLSSNLNIKAVPQEQPLPIGHIGRKSAKVIFHLINFWNFLSETQTYVKSKRSMTLLGHSVLKADEWLITIDGQLFTKDIIESLNKTGGYGITHVGCIEKESGNSFAKKEADELLKHLYYFLSFARGFRVTPFLPVGLNKRNTRTWENWGIGKIDPYVSIHTFTWFDEMKCKLSDVFPQFIYLIKQPIWENSLKKVILWYLLSNQRHAATEGSLILTQTALELLAWVHLVEDKKMLDSDGFKKLTAAQNIKIMLSSLKLPLEIPNQLTELTKLSKGYGWKDGPQGFAEIRNSIVHPDHKKRGKIQKGIFEAWNLGQWYIELILLRLFQYKGNYRNRLKLSKWRGEVEAMP